MLFLARYMIIFCLIYCCFSLSCYTCLISWYFWLISCYFCQTYCCTCICLLYCFFYQILHCFWLIYCYFCLFKCCLSLVCLYNWLETKSPHYFLTIENSLQFPILSIQLWICISKKSIMNIHYLAIQLQKKIAVNILHSSSTSKTSNSIAVWWLKLTCAVPTLHKKALFLCYCEQNLLVIKT